MEKMTTFFKKRGKSSSEDLYIQVTHTIEYFEQESFQVVNGEITILPNKNISAQDFDEMVNKPEIFLRIPPIVYWRNKKVL